MHTAINRFIKPLALAGTAASMIFAAGCSSGGGSTPSSTAPVAADDNLDGLIQDMPLDAVQQALDTVLIDTLAGNLPQEDGAELVADVGNAVLVLIEGPDALLSALLTAGGMLSNGEVDPDAYRMLLSDAGGQVVARTQQAAFALAAALLDASDAEPTADVVDAALALTAVANIANDPAVAGDPTTLLAALDDAVAALTGLSATDLGVPANAAEPVDAVLGMATQGLASVTELLVALTSGDSGTPADDLINPIEGLLTGILDRVPNLQDALAAIEDRTGFAALDTALELVTRISSVSGPQDAIDAAAAVIAPLIATIGPLTGGLSPLLCGVLGPLGGLAACDDDAG